MRQFKLLVLTDHSNHSAENSLYALVQSMRIHPRCQQVDVATRANELNRPFFEEHGAREVWVSSVDEEFSFSIDGTSFKKEVQRASIAAYDVVWLRMPPPLSDDFLEFLVEKFATQLFINDPKGIQLTGSKEFLINFQEHCPPMKVCQSMEDIMDFLRHFPIVLKPFREYGGKGIIRIDGDQVWEGNSQTTFAEFSERNQGKSLEYLGVKFLKNVSQGDKRIIVVNGKIMGSSLRLPAKDSWLCNVAMGGSSNFTEADADEIEIIRQINPILAELGIVMYGVDTLMGDDGKRVLSEINTTSIGGLPQAAILTGAPLVDQAIDSICNFIMEKLYQKNVIRSK